jgi:hypothetical protein
MGSGKQMIQVYDEYNLRIRWAEHVEFMVEKRNAYSILVGKREGKRSLGTHKCRWEILERYDGVVLTD